MRAKKILKVPFFFLILSFVILFPSDIHAQIAECDDAQEYIKGSWCPCPPDETLSSICGLVSSSDIDSFPRMVGDGVAHSTRDPIQGVTVALYENVDGLGTGQPWGELGNKLVECLTSEVNGKYFCPARRINPGNAAYVVFGCNGSIAGMRYLPTARSYITLDIDVDCPFTMDYVAMDEPLEYTDRNNILGCMSEEDKQNENVGFEERERVYVSPQIGEVDGDIRFTPYIGLVIDLPGIHTNYGGHTYGAFWENDCMVRYGGALPEFGEPEGNYDGLRRSFSLVGGSYQSVEAKCNYNNAMNEWDRNTTPFRYDIPDENVELTHRVWETRVGMQREYQNPRAFQQYNHLSFGECIGKASLREYGDDTEDTPISCREFIKCREPVGDPYRNQHTTHSYGARLASPVTWMDIFIDSDERDHEDPVCIDTAGDWGQAGEIKLVGGLEPPCCGECVFGEPDCRYTLPKDFYIPQYFVAAEGMKKPHSSETYGDTYGDRGKRSIPWDDYASEAQGPHISGHYVNYEDKSAHRSNSAMTSVRISSDQISDAGGILVNPIVDPVRAIDKEYDYESGIYVYDIGAEIMSMCVVSNVNDRTGLNNSELIIPDADTEGATNVSNDFVGDEASHREDIDEGTATYAPEEAIERDEYLRESAPGGIGINNPASAWLEGYLRDVFDSGLRFNSGDGVQGNALDIATYIGLIFNRILPGNEVKSFGERVDPNVSWTRDFPAVMETEFCISEGSFEGRFPVYRRSDLSGGVFTGGFPGNDRLGGSCYPWNYPSPLSQGDFCDVYPGPGEDPDGRLRTCRLDRCRIRTRTRYCIEETDWRCGWTIDPDGVTIPDTCCDPDGDGVFSTGERYGFRDCSDDDMHQCLVDQQVTSGIEPEQPPRPQAPGYDDRTRTRRWCDLSRAGPMIDDGDIGTADGFSQSGRIQQETWEITTALGPMQETQFTMDTVMQSANDFANRFRSPAQTKVTHAPLAFEGWASTNDLDGVRGGGFGATHKRTEGAKTKGAGMGSPVPTLQYITGPKRPGHIIAEDFPIVDTNRDLPYLWNCDPFDASDVDPNTGGVQHSWCYRPAPWELAEMFLCSIWASQCVLLIWLSG